MFRKISSTGTCMLRKYTTQNKLNHKEAQSLYERGQKCFQDRRFDKAQEYFNQAVELGSVQAINNLAVMYTEGFGVPKDLQLAKKLHLKGCEYGDPNSLYNLGRVLQLEGKIEEAIEILTPAVTMGGQPYGSSITSLGWIYFQFKRDYEKAKELYEKAISYGYTPANTYLGDYYSLVEKDSKQARKHYEAAAVEDDTRAMTILASMDVAENNTRRGIEALDAAIELGYVPAINQLGVIYVRGKKTPDPKDTIEIDYEKARTLFEKGVEKADGQAMMNLAFLHLNGFGTPKDPQKAVDLLYASIDAGCEEAKGVLENIQKQKEK
jgi:TPR repeat protein